MATSNKQNDSRHLGKQQSEYNIVCVNDSQLTDLTRKSKYDRKLLLLILLMLLIVSQVIVLLANSGFINQSPEPLSVNEQPITQDDIKAVNDELNEVIKSLDEINSNTGLKDDHVEVEDVVVKTMPVPTVVEQKPVKIEPEKKVARKTVAPVVTVPTEVAASKQVKIPEEPEKQVEVSVEELRPAYIKYDVNGKTLADNNQQWSCVHDTRNGLIWEVKSKGDTMRNPENLYSWFDPDNKGLKGVADGGRCKGGVGCDTNAYIDAINQKKLCGYDNWRLPTRDEMMGLVSFDGGDQKVKIDTSYFPETLPSWYWTASSNQSRPEFAWYILFKNGISLNDLKENPKHIRLVRDESSS